MNETCRITFITTIKLCKSYIDFKYRINMNIQQITKHCKLKNISYEIIVCEDICNINEEFLSDFFSKDFLRNNNLKLIHVKKDYYNPYNYNMLEAPSKNKAISEAKGQFICSMSGDIFLNDDFFDILHTLEVNCFYRFLSYNVMKLDIDYKNVTLDYYNNFCKQNTVNCINPLFDKKHINICDIALKSGDIMILDTNNFIKIKGFPECGIFHHTDYVVCKIVHNNNIKIIFYNNPIKVYTLAHERDTFEGSDSSDEYSIKIEQEQWYIANLKNNDLHCN